MKDKSSPIAYLSVGLVMLVAGVALVTADVDASGFGWILVAVGILLAIVGAVAHGSRMGRN